jgi:hypothetical protein
MLYLVLIDSDSRLFAQKQTPSQQKFQTIYGKFAARTEFNSVGF